MKNSLIGLFYEAESVYQNKGYATYLMRHAINLGANYCFLEASEAGISVYQKLGAYSMQVGIAVGLTADYGNAQRLYVKSGYIADGNGVAYQHQAVKWGNDYKADDDL